MVIAADVHTVYAFITMESKLSFVQSYASLYFTNEIELNIVKPVKFLIHFLKFISSSYVVSTSLLCQ